MLNKTIIGKQVGMTQIFDVEGKVIPVTVIEAGPCVVTPGSYTHLDVYKRQRSGCARGAARLARRSACQKDLRQEFCRFSTLLVEKRRFYFVTALKFAITGDLC